MRTIIDIEYIDKKISKKGKSYFLTTALLDDGTEATGWGEGFNRGDSVEVWFDERYNRINMQKPS